ncbi:MAG: hypothetical protein AB4368_23690, partial [Xenococcaceae cyanobacterium]
LSALRARARSQTACEAVGVDRGVSNSFKSVTLTDLLGYQTPHPRALTISFSVVFDRVSQ